MWRHLDQQRSELRAGSFAEVNRHLDVHSKPLHALPVDTVDQRIVAGRLAAIEKNSGAVTANRVRAAMSAMFTWGMKEGLVRANPVIFTNKRQEKSRDRVLADNELLLIWQALGDSQYGAIVKLLMLTGQLGGGVTAKLYCRMMLAGYLSRLWRTFPGAEGSGPKCRGSPPWRNP
jgi:hypothetical protein